jgi:hypothetical protein
MGTADEIAETGAVYADFAARPGGSGRVAAYDWRDASSRWNHA